MFCAKCGNQITEQNQYCPKCGAENINYVDGNQITKKDSSISNLLSDTNLDKEIIQKAMLLGIALAGVALGMIVIVILVKNFVSVTPVNDGKVQFSARGLNGYVVDGTSINFVDGAKLKTVSGNVQSGISTPDHSKFMVLFVDKKLMIYTSDSNEGVEIDSNVNAITKASDKGCFYSKDSNEHLFYYDFKNMSSTDTGMTHCNYFYSKNGNAALGKDKDNTIYLFKGGDETATTICSIEEDSKICCVSDSGSNFIWYIKDGSTLDVYTIINGAPERIGKITNAEKYADIDGYYYNDDKSFIVFSTGSSQMIRQQNGQIQEIVLPGVKVYSELFNSKGDSLDSDDDNIRQPYFLVAKTKTSNTAGIYQLMEDGSLRLEVEGIRTNEYYFYSWLSYSIKNGYLYFMNNEGDLYKKKLNADEDEVLITTDVKSVDISSQGKYAYVVKSNSLYYIDLSDKDFKLNLITSKFSDEDKVYVTNKDEVIYYISDKKEIKDSYSEMGTVYRYVVNKEGPVEIVKSVMYFDYNDKMTIDADSPIIEQYKSHKDYDYVINIGTIIDGTYKELVSSVKN